MYVAIVWKDNTFKYIHKVHGPFKSHDSAAAWALDRYPAPFAVVVQWMELPL